jgi:hypothetical protein
MTVANNFSDGFRLWGAIGSIKRRYRVFININLLEMGPASGEVTK